MGRPRWPAKRRGRGRTRDERARPRAGARSGSGLDDARVIGALSARGRGGVTAMRLLRMLGAERHELRALRRVLTRLERDGRIERFESGWRVPRADGLIEAELLAAGPASFAQRGEGERRPSGLRARDDQGREHRVDDDAGEAAAGDRVLIAPLRGGRAEVLAVLRGERERWVGILRGHDKNRMLGIGPYRDEGDWWVRVARGDTRGAQPGEVVAAVPAERRQRRSQRDGTPWARVVERYGRPGDPDADFEAVVWRHRLPVEFPDEVIAQAEALPDPDAREFGARTDLRDRAFVTIDPATARDHDDAVFVERTRGGHRLWVAIADVSHWVEPGSPIDREALRRGTSVYFTDRAIPMLPERLSGDVCSLRPDVDRLVLAVEMEFDEHGDRGRTRFHNAVIRSRARLSYEEAAAAIEDGDDSVPEATLLRDLVRLTRRLRERRRAAGSLDFELPSPTFTLDAEGYPIDVKPAPRRESHRAIEEAMLAANRTVAAWLVEHDVEAVHRIHESPAPPELANLAGELVALGLLDGAAADELPARELARALERAVGSPAERWIHQLALRAMRRARYSARSEAHYALGFERYLHFTSPIRRYPDLAVHRALKAAIAGQAPALTRARAEAIAVRSSYRERVAAAAEREMEQIKACVLLRDHVGELHEGAVTGLAPHGLYVTLDAWWVEGLVHVSRLPGYAELTENGRALVAGHARYELGDRVSVTIASADPVAARIDFDLVQPRRRRRGSA
jgi:ribonuclease R